MGHWAKVEDYVDNVGTVTQCVHVTDDADVAAGKLDGSPSDWVQFSYNVRGGVYYVADPTGQTTLIHPAPNQAEAIAAQGGRQRKNAAGIGYKYDRTRDAFYEPQPHSSWILVESTCLWQPPITYPTVTDDGQDPPAFLYDIYWNEAGHQADNTKGWEAFRVNVRDGSPQISPSTIYDWNGSAWISR